MVYKFGKCALCCTLFLEDGLMIVLWLSNYTDTQIVENKLDLHYTNLV